MLQVYLYYFVCLDIIYVYVSCYGTKINYFTCFETYKSDFCLCLSFSHSVKALENRLE